MRSILKDIVKYLIRSFVRFSCKVRIGRYFYSQIVGAVMEDVTEVVHDGVVLLFATPNALSKFRADTFATKEPETLEWIDSIPEGASFWDIGANVGLYSVYAAKKRNCQIWAFEPSIFNLELLARNVVLNELASQICIVPLALSDRLGASKLRLTTTDWGGALSTFSENYGWDGKPIHEIFAFQTIGLSMDDAIYRLALPRPEYIKIDVDGIEHMILSGGPSILGSAREILIEVNDDFEEQSEQCRNSLTAAGLVLKEKRHSVMFDNSAAGFQNTYNQIWVRR